MNVDQRRGHDVPGRPGAVAARSAGPGRRPAATPRSARLSKCLGEEAQRRRGRPVGGAADGGTTSGGAVGGRVGTHQRRADGLPTGQASDGRVSVGDHPFGGAGRAAGSLAQPLVLVHPSGPWGGERSQQPVQSADGGVAVAGALLAVAVDLDDRGVAYASSFALGSHDHVSISHSTLVSAPRHRAELWADSKRTE